jgi:hypothetical protein
LKYLVGVSNPIETWFNWLVVRFKHQLTCSTAIEQWTMNHELFKRTFFWTTNLWNYSVSDNVLCALIHWNMIGCSILFSDSARTDIKRKGTYFTGNWADLNIIASKPAWHLRHICIWWAWLPCTAERPRSIENKFCNCSVISSHTTSVVSLHDYIVHSSEGMTGLNIASAG